MPGQLPPLVLPGWHRPRLLLPLALTVPIGEKVVPSVERWMIKFAVFDSCRVLQASRACALPGVTVKVPQGGGRLKVFWTVTEVALYTIEPDMVGGRLTVAKVPVIPEAAVTRV